MIAQKYRLHSQVHSNTTKSSSNNDTDVDNQKNCQNIPECISNDSDSDNSEDSGNLIIKEDTEEDTDQNEKEIKNVRLDTIEKLSSESHEENNIVNQESKVDNSDIKNGEQEEKSENQPSPASTCEVNIFLIC